ncbi:MAG: hypothetical protein OXN22_05285, partial [Deltaproteobacteria bacterium]|nr:hypothetical protein [Deltaproteobacteria bacterium]
MSRVVIDVHAHFTPPEWVQGMRRTGGGHGCHIEEDASGRLSLRVGEGRAPPRPPVVKGQPARGAAQR